MGNSWAVSERNLTGLLMGVAIFITGLGSGTIENRIAGGAVVQFGSFPRSLQN